MTGSGSGRPLAIDIIFDEHRSIRAALQTIASALPAGGSRAASVFDGDTVRAMLAYLDGFPEQIHHPKEDESLFALLERRDPDAVTLIGALRSEHSYGQNAMRALQVQADALVRDDPAAIEQFSQAMKEFDAFYRAHMQLEETVLLPIAERTLTVTDWHTIDTTFAGNLDPLRGGRDAQAFATQLKGVLDQLRRGAN